MSSEFIPLPRNIEFDVFMICLKVFWISYSQQVLIFLVIQMETLWIERDQLPSVETWPRIVLKK